jgi:hypothetical protein
MAGLQQELEQLGEAAAAHQDEDWAAQEHADDNFKASN